MDRAWLAALLALACAGLPDPPAPGTSQVWGDVRLVPPDGVTTSSQRTAYGDRRLRDTRLVDYSQPGFVVVYVGHAEPPAGLLDLEIRDSQLGPRIEPALAAVSAAGRIAVRNLSGLPHVLSYPAADRVERLAPGERMELEVPRAGEQGLFLLSAPSVAATVFGAPGPFSVISAAGRFTLTDLVPGPTELRVWHPRFPPAARQVDLPPDAQVRVDFEIGVGRGEGGGHAH